VVLEHEGAEMSGPDTAATWIDKAAIQEVINGYCDALNRNDWDAYEALFTPDAVWELSAPWGFKVEGARAIRELISKLVGRGDFIVQTSQSTVVKLVGPDRATATTSVHETSRGKDGGSSLHLGIYCDELVRGADGWKFQHRFFQSVYYDETPLTGRVDIARADLLAATAIEIRGSA
jgi:ketosteroid isomerase-like protein